MSGFENYPRELADLDREIHRYAAICGVDLSQRHEVERCLSEHHANWSDDKARESLMGLLVLRIKVETEMLEQGLLPPPLHEHTPVQGDAADA